MLDKAVVKLVLVLVDRYLYLFSVVTHSGLVSHSDLDDRAIEALKEFNEEGALQVLLQFKDSDLSHVQVCVSHCRCSKRNQCPCCFLWHFVVDLYLQAVFI